MPTISMFYGIIIQMFYPPDEHPPPHFHARYAEFEAAIEIDTGDVMSGKLPKRQMRFVQAWAELHKEELQANWRLAQEGLRPFSIEPLR